MSVCLSVCDNVSWCKGVNKTKWIERILGDMRREKKERERRKYTKNTDVDKTVGTPQFCPGKFHWFDFFNALVEAQLENNT